MTVLVNHERDPVLVKVTFEYEGHYVQNRCVDNPLYVNAADRVVWDVLIEYFVPWAVLVPCPRIKRLLLIRSQEICDVCVIMSQLCHFLRVEKVLH